MESNYSYQINQTGEQIIITDETEWGTLPNPERADYALFAGAVKFSRNGEDTFLEKSNGFSYGYYSPSFDNTIRSIFRFDLGEDGYHILKLIPIILNDTSATEVGSLYYDLPASQIYKRDSSEWIPITYEEMILDESIIGMSVKKLAVHPKFEKTLDRVWKSYEHDAYPKNGKDYNNFYLGYGMLIGAASSVRKGNFEEYDRKITIANQLSKRWI